MENNKSNTVTLSRVADDQRMFTTLSYMLFLWSSVIVIQGFSMGQSMLPPFGVLNITQAITACVVGSLILVCFFSLTGGIGMKYGIPFAVQIRASFGPRGAKFATLLRGLPAVFWLGISCWIGASALSVISNQLLGFGNQFVCFIIFIIVCVTLSALGMKSIKWFENAMAIFIVAIMLYMIFHLVNAFNAELSEDWHSSGSWGLPFIGCIVAVTGSLFTVAINNADIGRYLKNDPKVNWIGHLLGVPVSNLFLMVLGILAGSAVGEWDPITALVKVSPNTTVAMILCIFIAIAQITTNMTANLLPPALIIMDFFPKIKWWQSNIIVGVLAIATCPWILFTSGNFFTFINTYSAFLGPVLGIMLIDYFFVHNQKYAIEDMYTNEKKIYNFSNGINWAAIIATLVGGVIGRGWFADYSWLVSAPIGIIVYIILYNAMYKKDVEAKLAENADLLE